MSSEINVGDLATFKTRVLKRQCGTCVYRPDSPVMDPERCQRFEQQALGEGGFIPCHSTYAPLGEGPAAICRGFFTRNKGTGILGLMERLYGFVFVDPPK